MSIAPTAKPFRIEPEPPLAETRRPAGDLADHASRPKTGACIPAIVGVRCVHARIETASCRACVTACPHDAWIIDDERVGIDLDACDGCELCVPACPEGAISSSRERADDSRAWNGQPAVFRACEMAGTTGQSGVIPCLHAVGVRELLRSYRRGVTSWIVCAAPCDTCPRGGNPRIQNAARQVNALLVSRGLQPLSLLVLEPARWTAALRQAAPGQTEVAVTRRGFFAKATRAILDTASEIVADRASVPDDFTPATAWLPRTGPGDLYLHRPSIDPSRCDGCDACARLCPHGAIALAGADDGLRYQLDAGRCTGCGICRDACDRDAIAIDPLRAGGETILRLVENRCPVCGVLHHAPETALSTDQRCRICARTPHARLLHQVLG